MTITEIRISAGRTFNHPTERYANLRFDISIVVHLDPGDSATHEVVDTLRGQVERKAEQHKADLLHDIDLEGNSSQVRHELSKALQWEKTAAQYAQEVANAEAALGQIDSWAELKTPQRNRILEIAADGSYTYYITHHDTMEDDATRSRLTQDLKDVAQRAAQRCLEERERGPRRVQAAQAKVDALPAFRLFAGAVDAAKDIAPGHPDHPETGNREEDHGDE